MTAAGREASGEVEAAAEAEAVGPMGAAEQVRPRGEAAEEVRPSGAVAEVVRPTGAAGEIRPTGAAIGIPPMGATVDIRSTGAAGEIRPTGAVEVAGNNAGTAAVIGFVPREEIPTFISHSEMVARVKRARALAMGTAME